MKPILLALACALVAAAVESQVSRVGVYDSRAVAYAHFWSMPVQQQHAALAARAQAAKETGDDAQFQQVTAMIKAQRKQSHLEVFSSAPATEAMTALHDRLPGIKQELGVTRLVSKWDTKTLAGVPTAYRIDVTDRLVHEFLPAPTPRQQQTIAAMKRGKPLPLWEARLLNAFNAM
ncbi:MAG TPA: hypothetical protein VL284_01450 [Thermoanaerobaculia bacterium]|nr:hypothetical protein [Thermoanaerobaculia bacterium]